jgi:hypothetical protein
MKNDVVKPNNGGQNTSSQYVATFPAKNQPFREPQTWYNVPALYHLNNGVSLALFIFVKIMSKII